MDRPSNGRDRQLLEIIREHEEGFQIVATNGLGEGFWCGLLDELYRRLKQQLKDCPQLDSASTQMCTAIARQVLQDAAVALIGETERASLILRQRAVGKQRSFSVESKDFWAISSLRTLIGHENEHGRHTVAFPAETAHPRSFICYGFSAGLDGRHYLEKEARALWADSLLAPVVQTRRFREFYKLYKEISRKYTFRIGASAKVRLVAVPPLPPKASLSFVSGHDETFIGNRRRCLEIWLRYMSLHRIISISTPFRSFMLEPSTKSLDSDSVSGDSSTTYSASIQSNVSSLQFTKEDPIVARRARKQVDEVLARYGSGPVALSAIHAVIPPLENSLISVKSATKNVVKKMMISREAQIDLAGSLLDLSKNVLQSPSSKSKFRLEPISRLGVALKNNKDVAVADDDENWSLLEQSIRMWSKHLIPEMKNHVAHIKSASLVEMQDESYTKVVSPSERVSAEWFEMSQVRACMLVKATEDLAHSQIILARKNAIKWEQVKAKLLDFDVDQFFESPEQKVGFEPHNSYGTAIFDESLARFDFRHVTDENKSTKGFPEWTETANLTPLEIPKHESISEPVIQTSNYVQSIDNNTSDDESFEANSRLEFISRRKTVTFADDTSFD